MTVEKAEKVIISEMDIDTLYKIARGKTYKEIAMLEGMTEQTIKSRMAAIKGVFGAVSMPHLIAILIASDVLRVHDLYQPVDVHVREYRRVAKYGRSETYRLQAVRV
jgi:DNA-binding CsgD family transcriptional regulator